MTYLAFRLRQFCTILQGQSWVQAEELRAIWVPHGLRQLERGEERQPLPLRLCDPKTDQAQASSQISCSTSTLRKV